MLEKGGLWCQELFEGTYFPVILKFISTTVENQLNQKGEVCKNLAFLDERLFKGLLLSPPIPGVESKSNEA